MLRGISAGSKLTHMEYTHPARGPQGTPTPRCTPTPTAPTTRSWRGFRASSLETLFRLFSVLESLQKRSPVKPISHSPLRCCRGRCRCTRRRAHRSRTPPPPPCPGFRRRRLRRVRQVPSGQRERGSAERASAPASAPEVRLGPPACQIQRAPASK